MDEDALSNIINLLQGSNNSQNTINNNNGGGFANNQNNDMQALLLKMLMSGAFNNLLTPKSKEPEATPPIKRTIDLENYKRID